MKKRLFITSLLTLSVLFSWACPVCERNQPKLLRGLVHGPGHDGWIDYLIVAIMVLISLITLFFSLKHLIKPGEKKANHIKRMIINTEEYER